MRSIFSVLAVAALMAAMIAVAAVPAFADPLNQPFNGDNCHGYWLSHNASTEPEGIGNYYGGQDVDLYQEGIQSRCA